MLLLRDGGKQVFLDEAKVLSILVRLLDPLRMQAFRDAAFAEGTVSPIETLEINAVVLSQNNGLDLMRPKG